MPSTDTEVRRAKPLEKAYRLSDARSRYLWVTPAGGKLSCWAYKHEGREKLKSLRTMEQAASQAQQQAQQASRAAQQSASQAVGQAMKGF